MTDRVPVHYFEKKKKGAPPPSERLTQDLQPPLGLSRTPSLGEMEPPIATQPSTDPPDPRKGRRRKKRGDAREPSQPPPPVDAATPDPGGRLPVEQVDAWLAAGRIPPDDLRRMSRKQVAELCLHGHDLFERGRLDEARVVFEGVVSVGSEEAFPHTMLGTVYLAQGKAQEALPRFESAIELDPKDVAALVYRGEIRLRAGQLRAGLADLRKAVRLASGTDPFVVRARKLIDRAGGRRGRR